MLLLPIVTDVNTGELSDFSDFVVYIYYTSFFVTKTADMIKVIKHKIFQRQQNTNQTCAHTHRLQTKCIYRNYTEIKTHIQKLKLEIMHASVFGVFLSHLVCFSKFLVSYA